MGDAMFGAPSRLGARQALAQGRDAWLARFDVAPTDRFGACHCIELPFVFGTLRAFAGAPMLAGLSAGVSGVLLPAQIDDYGVDKAIVGLTFFTNAAGFLLAGAATGPLLHRFGIRATLALGGAAPVLAWLYLAGRPAFVLLVLAQLLLGFGIGVFESVLNVYLAGLPGSTALLNRLHAFFGVGAPS